MHIPAILQNPVNPSLRQVEAHNAQQKLKSIARREAREEVKASGSTRGKRYIRRKENAVFSSNPHIVAPKRSDCFPPVPLQAHNYRASPFPYLPRSEPVPSPGYDHNSDPRNSLHGAFSTSLKGTRQMLRKRGRRAEQLVNVAEKELRGWLGGSWLLHPEEASWRVIDPYVSFGDAIARDELTEEANEGEGEQLHKVEGGGKMDRRMPLQYRLGGRIPDLPRINERVAVMELSRSPVHLTWAVKDGFERLVLHLLCRYYDLVTWSEDHVTHSGESVRLTHIIRPTLARSSNQASVPSLSLDTPYDSETGVSSQTLVSDSGTGTAVISDVDLSDSEADFDSVRGYSLDDPPDPEVRVEVVEEPSVVRRIPLVRVLSDTSSQYGGSEWGSEYSGMGDSLILPTPTPTSVSRSDPSDTSGYPPAVNVVEEDISPAVMREIPTVTRRSMNAIPMGWEDRPTFFDYLYGGY
ncbi:hypothetical protein M231_01859 [Tremella mesenterica]|uniref:R3H-associated N-terminal domain-containing protein n=1 Tax=Tremella mesenterica TaxID=5217 RepID=A0A4Q1BS77_TREME|nr:hypothetical protein M231_01859 [Tremella mesenterica]